MYCTARRSTRLLPGGLQSVLLHRHSGIGRIEGGIPQRIRPYPPPSVPKPHMNINTSAAKYPIGNGKNRLVRKNIPTMFRVSFSISPGDVAPPCGGLQLTETHTVPPPPSDTKRPLKVRRGIFADKHKKIVPPPKQNGAESRRIRLRRVRTPPDHFVSPIFSMSAFVSGLWPRKAT